jgi:hypothetical protein
MKESFSPIVDREFITARANNRFGTFTYNPLQNPDSNLSKSTVLDLASPSPYISQPNKNYIFDRSRYGNHGTITGATWVTLPSGLKVLYFDGTDDSVNCGNLLDVVPTTFTILYWIKPVDGVGTSHTIFSKFNINAQDRIWVSYNQDTDSLIISWEENDHGLQNLTTTGVAPETWYFGGMRWSPVSGMTAFLNGAVSGNTAGATTLMRNGTYTDFRWGVGGAGTEFFNGYQSLGRVITGDVSDSEINSIFQSERHLIGV